MAFILFQDRKHPIEAQAKKLGPHHIEITGCSINTSGFKYFQDAAMIHKYGDFNDFTTLYRELDESYILSDDGSVYPEIPESAETPELPLREIVKSLKNKVADIQIASAERHNDVIQAKSEITDIQIAVCEIYEMIGGDIMAAVYATLIVKGIKTFTEVPAGLREQVKEILINLELPDLIVE